MASQSCMIMLLMIGLACFTNFCSGRRQLNCDDCHIITDYLQKELGHQRSDDIHHELAGEVRPRRRMIHTLSEREIFKKLDAVCTQVADASAGTAEWFREPCARLIGQHRDTLENHIFAKGVEDLRRVLCTDLTALCRHHELHDSGEL